MREESTPSQPSDTDDSLLVEVSDLRIPEDQPARPLVPRRLTTRQRLRRVLSAALAVALALLAITISVRGFALPNLHLFERQPPRPIALSVSSADMSFLEDMAWSPDGRRIALLGCLSDEAGPCEDAQHYIPNVVLIYDAASAKLVTRIHPDGPVLAELHVLDPADIPVFPFAGAESKPPVLVNVNVIGFQVLWSPDGRHLALLFRANVPPRQGQSNYWNGVVLVKSDGTHSQALFDLNPQPGITIWNLAAGVSLPAASASPAFTSFPSALAYRWGADDTLLSETPLVPGVVPPAPSLAPVGNPDGGTRFTLWQPGSVTPITNSDPTAPPAPPSAFSFNATFAAWSPDSTRLADLSAFSYATPVLVSAGQQPPDLPVQYSGPGGPKQPSFLTVRDKALQHLLDLGPVPNVAESGWDVAWRPDGRVLAAYGISTTPDSPHPVTLYDCASGRQLAALQPPTGTLVPDGFNGGILRWSPDGTRLLSYIQRNSLTIWEPGLLS